MKTKKVAVKESNNRVSEEKCSGKILMGWSAVLRAFASTAKMMNYIITKPTERILSFMAERIM